MYVKRLMIGVTVFALVVIVAVLAHDLYFKTPERAARRLLLADTDAASRSYCDSAVLREATGAVRSLGRRRLGRMTPLHIELELRLRKVERRIEELGDNEALRGFLSRPYQPGEAERPTRLAPAQIAALYPGARFMRGNLLAQYQDGLVVQSGGDIYCVFGASAPSGTAGSIEGYVRNSGGRMPITIGMLETTCIKADYVAPALARLEQDALSQTIRAADVSYRRDLKAYGQEAAEHQRELLEYEEALERYDATIAERNLRCGEVRRDLQSELERLSAARSGGE